jgi:GT2 family glycosyltransferase
MMTKEFACFIMTYERPHIIVSTIMAILNQTIKPEKILVIDNSESLDTQNVVDELSNPLVSYYKVGYNSGPAGAAKLGLRLLAEEGYRWIYWGDDDNPPDFNDSFELLFDIIKSKRDLPIGVVASVGQYFNRITGNIIRVPDSLLKDTDSISVDSIAGGMCMIVNSDVVRLGALPEAKLFFGFEELDFCLKVKQLGFKLVVSSKLFRNSRIKYNRVNYQRPVYAVKNLSGLKRQYYSTRNLLMILRRNKLYPAVLYQTAKSLLKAFFGFRYGMNYGKVNFHALSKGIFDGLFKKIANYF